MTGFMGNGDQTTGDREWQPCPPGALVATAHRLRTRQAAVVAAARRKVVTGIVAVAAVVFGGGLAAWQVNDRTPVVVLPATEISCEETMALLERFADGDLAIGYEAAVRAHLDACPRCSTRFNQMFPAVPCDADLETGHAHDAHDHVNGASH